MVDEDLRRVVHTMNWPLLVGHKRRIGVYQDLKAVIRFGAVYGTTERIEGGIHMRYVDARDIGYTLTVKLNKEQAEDVDRCGASIFAELVELPIESYHDALVKAYSKRFLQTLHSESKPLPDVAALRTQINQEIKKGARLPWIEVINSGKATMAELLAGVLRIKNVGANSFHPEPPINTRIRAPHWANDTIFFGRSGLDFPAPGSMGAHEFDNLWPTTPAHESWKLVINESGGELQFGRDPYVESDLEDYVNEEGSSDYEPEYVNYGDY